MFEDQIACADLVVLNKRDLLDAAGIGQGAGRDRTARCRARCKVVTVADGKVDPAALLGLGVGTEDDIENRKTHHDDELDHDHDDFDSFVVDAAGDRRSRGARQARRRPSPRAHDVLRMKGFVAVARQADAAAGAGGRAARQPSLRPALGAADERAHAPGGDRPEGPRPRRRSTQARCADRPMHLLPTTLRQPRRHRRAGRSRPAAGRYRGAVVRRQRSRRARGGLGGGARSRCRACGSRICAICAIRCRSICGSTSVGAPRQGDRGAPARRARLVALRRRPARRRWRASAASRWRCCPARTATTRGSPQPRPCRPTSSRRCSRYFREGGRENLRALLRRLAGHAGRDARLRRAAAGAATGRLSAGPRRGRSRCA